MTAVPAIAQEAIELARRGELEKAIVRAHEAVQAHPDDTGLRLFTAMLHVRRNELSEALPHLKAAIDAGAGDPFAKIELIRVLIGLGQFDEADAKLEQFQLPGTQPVRLRGMLLQARGEMAGAAELYEQVVRSDAQDFESWGNLGICLLGTDRPQQAIHALARSLALRPDRLSVRYKWAEAHFMAGSGEEALSEMRELARQAPSNADAWVAIAHIENLLGRPDQSLAAVEQALQRDADDEYALVALAEAVEQRNDLDRFQETVGRLTNLGRPVEKLPLLQARLAYRRGEYDQALALAKSAPPSGDAGSRAQIIGQCLDRLGDPGEAFKAFLEMNLQDARAGGLTGQSAQRSREALAEQRKLLTPDRIDGWMPADPPNGRDPAFLVGFPRSGTTLLDTLLMGHPGAAVGEEEPMLAIVRRAAGDLSRIATLPDREVDELRQLYFEEAAARVANARERLLIDKNPLAMSEAALIHRLFPGSPVILVERHPCDVVLSCFMTRFQPIGIGTNFLTLKDTALLYDEMMQLWAKSTEVLPLRTRIVRYERLVEDPEMELRPVTDFLGLEWLPQLLDHRATAKARAFIKTPSYAQVTEPVTARPVGRWTRYREQLEQVLPILEPWANRMGYEI